MRKYKLVLPESIAKEKARKAELEKRKKEREKQKEREKKKREKERENAKKKKIEKLEKEKEKERIKKEKLREKKKKIWAKRKYKNRMKKKKAEQRAYYLEHKAEIMKEKRAKTIAKKKRKREYDHEYRITHRPPERVERMRLKAEAKEAKKLEEKKKQKKKANRKYQSKQRQKRYMKAYNEKYYREHAGKEAYERRMANNDVKGRFIIATAQDLVLKRKCITRVWWNDVMEKWNELVGENHANAMCPVDEIANDRTFIKRTQMEILLLKQINSDVEDNISVFRDETGKVVKVKTDNEDWVVVLKEPWYVEEKFVVSGLSPTREKKTAQWIGENFIEKGLSKTNFKKVLMWRNYVIIDGDEDFDFCIGKTVRAATNLYMALFKKYNETEYVYFIGVLDATQVSKWTQKIKDKTGWENLERMNTTYKSSSKADNSKDMPTKSKSTRSASGKSSGKR